MTTFPSAFDLAFGPATGRPAPLMGPVDVFERDGALHLMVDLPGVARDDVELLVAERRLTVRAERRVGPDPTDRVLRGERHFGSIERSFTMDRQLDADTAVADLRDGVLSVQVAYADSKAGPRRVEIGGAAHSDELSEAPGG